MGSCLSVPFLVDTLEPRHTATSSRSRDWGRRQEPDWSLNTAQIVSRNKRSYGLLLKCALFLLILWIPAIQPPRLQSYLSLR